MIHLVLQAIRNELTSFLTRRLKTDTAQPRVVLSKLTDLGDTALDRLICTLVKVEQETVRANVGLRGEPPRVNPPLQLNLLVLISANYRPENYLEALQALSAAIGYFQGKAVFTPANTPGLPERIEKVNVEPVELDMGEFGHLWTALGSSHLPSVLYRLRMISTTEDLVLEQLSEITAVVEKQ